MGSDWSSTPLQQRCLCPLVCMGHWSPPSPTLPDPSFISLDLCCSAITRGQYTATTSETGLGTSKISFVGVNAAYVPLDPRVRRLRTPAPASPVPRLDAFQPFATEILQRLGAFSCMAAWWRCFFFFSSPPPSLSPPTVGFKTLTL